GWPSKDELSSLALTPSPSQLYFHLQLVNLVPDLEDITEKRDGLPKEKVDAMAMALRALWPKGVICRTCRRPDKDGKPSYTDEINTVLVRLRAVDEHNGQTEVIPLKHRKRVPQWFGRF
ncbi:hypothetical protein RSAG8_09468, partial [Rhizoctonia solani AG-8 WAC10335]